MKDFKELAAILNAAAEGKVIEEYDRVNNTWSEVTPSDLKYKNACNAGYLRVKPELKYTPYKSAIDVVFDVKNHGPYVRFKDDGVVYHTLTCVYEDYDGKLKVEFDDFDAEEDVDEKFDERNAEYIFENYEWQDGHPFGILLV